MECNMQLAFAFGRWGELGREMGPVFLLVELKG
jgi:hypothetical protein